MSDFRNKLLNEVINPAQSKNRVYTLIATIVGPTIFNFGSSYEIEFINEHGEKQKKSGVKVRSYGNDTSGTYKPKVGDTVLVEQENNEYTIIGAYQDDLDREKTKMELKSDVYTSLIYDAYPGFHF